MKVLFIHHYFVTPEEGGAIRSYHMALALQKAGHEVIVFTAHNQRFYKKEIIHGIEVHYLPVYYDNRLGFWRRCYAFCKFLFLACWKALYIKNCTHCYASSSPLTVGLIALFLKKVKKIPYLFEVMDLWPEAPIQMGFIKNRWLKKILYWIEKKSYQGATRIIAASPGMKAGILNKTPEKEVILIPNFADTTFFYPIPPSDQLLKKFKITNQFVISYTGSLGISNDVNYIINAATYANEYHPNQFYFLIAGKGAHHEWAKQRTQERQLTNIQFVEHVNKETIREIYAVAHANLVSFLKIPILETNSPNKFFDGLAAGKLTIITIEGWIKDLCEKYKCGIYAPAYEQLFEKLLPFIQDPLHLDAYSRNARLLAEKEFKQELLLDRFLNCFKKT